MFNRKYPSGLLLETRKVVRGHVFRYENQRELLGNVSIPYKRCVTLLEHVFEFDRENIAILWDNKIIFVFDVDLEHDFKIIA